MSINTNQALLNALSNAFNFSDGSINEMGYGERIDLYIKMSGDSKETVANELGITVRTLGEFTRPQGRTPSKPICKLINSKLSIYFLLENIS